MTEEIRVRMDRGGIYSTVHGERAPDDKHAATHFYQNDLPYDAEGYLIMDHADFEAERGDQCSAKAADLRRRAHVLIAAAKKKAARKAEERRRIAEQDAHRSPSRRTLPRAETSRPVPPPPAPVPPPPAPAPVAPPPVVRTAPPPSVLQVGNDQPPAGDLLDEETEADVADEHDNAGGDDSDEEAGDNADDFDDEDEDEDPPEPNIEAYLRGEEEIQWHIFTQILARKHARRFANLEDALYFLVVDPEGPKVVPVNQLKPQFQKKLQ